jgi:hypothetical protein
MRWERSLFALLITAVLLEGSGPARLIFLGGEYQPTTDPSEPEEKEKDSE